MALNSDVITSYSIHYTKLYDVDKDGYKEIIILSRCRSDDYFGKDQIIILNQDGTVKEGWPIYIESGEQELNIAVQDIDGNGRNNFV